MKEDSRSHQMLRKMEEVSLLEVGNIPLYRKGRPNTDRMLKGPKSTPRIIVFVFHEEEIN